MTACDAVNGSHYRHLGTKMRLLLRSCVSPFLMQWTAPSIGIAMCQIAFLLKDAESLLMANNGLSNHVAGTSALPPRADIRWPMSAFAPFRSVLPSGTELVPGNWTGC